MAAYLDMVAQERGSFKRRLPQKKFPSKRVPVVPLKNSYSTKLISYSCRIPQYFSLQNEHNRKLLDVCQKKTDPGTPVIVWPPDRLFKRAKGNQMWYETSGGHICTKLLNHFVLDIPGTVFTNFIS